MSSIGEHYNKLYQSLRKEFLFFNPAICPNLTLFTDDPIISGQFRQIFGNVSVPVQIMTKIADMPFCFFLELITSDQWQDLKKGFVANDYVPLEQSIDSYHPRCEQHIVDCDSCINSIIPAFFQSILPPMIRSNASG